MSLKTTRPTVVLMIMPGLNSLSPSPRSRREAGSRSLIIACRATLPWLCARKTSFGVEKTMSSPSSLARPTVR